MASEPTKHEQTDERPTIQFVPEKSFKFLHTEKNGARPGLNTLMCKDDHVTFRPIGNKPESSIKSK